MGWVKRLADHVIQDRFGAPDLEFAWLDLKPEDPDQQSKILDLYVRSGIYAVNEARQVLGLDPVPGGDRPMVYGTQGPVPLASALVVRNTGYGDVVAPVYVRNISATRPEHTVDPLRWEIELCGNAQ